MRRPSGTRNSSDATGEAEAQRERFQSIFDHAAVLLVLWNAAGEDLEVQFNRHAEAVLGSPATEGVRAELRRAFEPAATGSVRGSREIEMRSARGEVVPVEWACLRLSDGTVVGIGVDRRERERVDLAAIGLDRAPRPRGPHRMVLVIDDNPDVADSLRDALELAGHEVKVAYGANTGIELASAFRPDVVICDIGLPGISGHDVASVLRSIPGLEGVWLVAFSGFTRPEDIARSRAAGFDYHLAKPAYVEEVEDLISRLGRS